MPKLLEKRPEPPILDEILEDLNNSSQDDVAFNFLSASSQSNDVIQAVNQTQGNKSPDMEKTKYEFAVQQHNENHPPITDVDACYAKVEKILQHYDYLKNSQTTLQDQCNDLEEMGQHVQDQITQLKAHLT